MDELKAKMEEKMEVFLQKSTADFIKTLFETLETKEYLNGPPPKPGTVQWSCFSVFDPV